MSKETRLSSSTPLWNSQYQRKNLQFIRYNNDTVLPPGELTRGGQWCVWGGLGAQWASDVMLLVICSETRGEILLRCHCSVKLHTAGQISLTRHILWKSRNTVLFPTGLRNGWGNMKNTLHKWTTVSYFNSLTHRYINYHQNTNKDIRISCTVSLSNEQPSLSHVKEPHWATIQKSMKHSS